jgi:hypothetical protein
MIAQVMKNDNHFPPEEKGKRIFVAQNFVKT